MLVQVSHDIPLLCYEIWSAIRFFPMPFSDLIVTSHVLGSHARYRFKDCADSDEIEKIKGTYIENLRTSNYNYFCDTYGGLCTKENVEVTCWVDFNGNKEGHMDINAPVIRWIELFLITINSNILLSKDVSWNNSFYMKHWCFWCVFLLNA